MMRNKKISIFLGVLRRTGPEWIAAIALGWLLREIPSLAWNGGKGILQRAPVVWAEGRTRIPPTKANLLKGTAPAIAWINDHVPRDQPLLYVGRMSKGIRLRYYTFPRSALWHYLYTTKDAAKALEILESYSPAYVAMERLPKTKDFAIPGNWQKAWNDKSNQLLIYKVVDDAGE